jgi:hypothetical protein
MEERCCIRIESKSHKFVCSWDKVVSELTLALSLSHHGPSNKPAFKFEVRLLGHLLAIKFSPPLNKAVQRAKRMSTAFINWPPKEQPVKSPSVVGTQLNTLDELSSCLIPEYGFTSCSISGSSQRSLMLLEGNSRRFSEKQVALRNRWEFRSYRSRRRPGVRC